MKKNKPTESHPVGVITAQAYAFTKAKAFALCSSILGLYFSNLYLTCISALYFSGGYRLLDKVSTIKVLRFCFYKSIFDINY